MDLNPSILDTLQPPIRKRGETPDANAAAFRSLNQLDRSQGGLPTRDHVINDDDPATGSNDIFLDRQCWTFGIGHIVGF